MTSNESPRHNDVIMMSSSYQCYHQTNVIVIIQSMSSSINNLSSNDFMSSKTSCHIIVIAKSMAVPIPCCLHHQVNAIVDQKPKYAFMVSAMACPIQPASALAYWTHILKKKLTCSGAKYSGVPQSVKALFNPSFASLYSMSTAYPLRS